MPLPSPRVNEDLNDFIGRCVIDPNVVNDFATQDQRIAVCNSLYSQEKEIKAAKENYTAKFSDQLAKAERSSVKDFYKFYNDQYDQASAMFIRQGALSATDVSVFFKENDLINMYTEMYSKIGLHFALWYYKNVDKLLEKASNIDNLMSIWAKSFAFVGQQVGAQRVTLVSGTAKNTLIAVTQKLMSDPAFMNQGEKVKAKMLKTQFNKYSTYQAKRLVRTEATNAANSATIASAQTVFAGKDLIKRWHTIMDGRERASHGAANGQTVPTAGKFSVQGQFLKWAGDPAGSASNVINCRCGVSVFPKPNAQTTGENITDIGFGVAQAQVQSAITEALITPEVATTIAVEAQQVNLQSQKELMRPDNWNEILGNNKINDDFLALLPQKVELIKANIPTSDALGYQVRIGKYARNGQRLTRTITHEFGHVIHHERGWLTQDFSDPIINEYFKKHQNMIGLNLRGEERMRALKEFNFKLSTIDQSLFPELTNSQFLELDGDVKDFFGALSKNKVGSGHDTSYYVGNRGKYEYVAHAFENKYAGNIVFEKIYPEFYKDSIEMLDLLINR